MTRNQQAEANRWILKRISRDYVARAGVCYYHADEWHKQFMRHEYTTANLHERINRRGHLPGDTWNE